MSMPHMANAILMIVLIMNLLALGSSRILAVIRTVGAQGAILGLLPLLIHGRFTMAVVLATLVAVILKGIIIPNMMAKALRDTNSRREVEPLIGLMPSVVFGAMASVFALLFSGSLPLAPEHEGSLLVPTAMATLLSGFILLITRYKALTQVVGYLMLENGIYIFGMLLLEAMPFVIEMGVLLDLFVGIFVISIIVNRINKSFSSIDTRRLISLKE